MTRERLSGQKATLCEEPMGMPQVAILAGGLGTRLGNLTADCPKSMVRVCGKPFLQHQIELLRSHGVTDILLCTGHLGSQIEEYFGDGTALAVTIRYSQEIGTLLGTAGCLKNAEAVLDDPFMILYGDSYLPVDYREIARDFHQSGKMGLMTVYRNENQYDASNVVVRRNMVTCYSKSARTPEMVYIDYGVSVLSKSVLELIPRDEVFTLEELYNLLIEEGELAAHEVQERFYEIGSLSGLRECEEFIFRRGTA